MSLRDGAVETMADAWKEARQSPVVNIAAASVALDALCDYLIEELREEAEKWNWSLSDRIIVNGVLAVLRESADV